MSTFADVPPVNSQAGLDVFESEMELFSDLQATLPITWLDTCRWSAIFRKEEAEARSMVLA